LKVNEIFYSIQGEGIHQGEPTVFIRLQGCNLRCTWCDTDYAQDLLGGEEKTLEQIVTEVRGYSQVPRSWVCITGGEPLYHLVHLEQLTRTLAGLGYRVEVETNGSVPRPPWWARVNSWCADIKCPSSDFPNSSLEEWFDGWDSDQVKFVVAGEEDLRFASEKILHHQGKEPQVLVSPVILQDEFVDARWMDRVVEFCKEHHVRFSLQLHKIIWGWRRGV